MIRDAFAFTRYMMLRSLVCLGLAAVLLASVQ
jgi:hypothetical protein